MKENNVVFKMDFDGTKFCLVKEKIKYCQSAKDVASKMETRLTDRPHYYVTESIAKAAVKKFNAERLKSFDDGHDDDFDERGKFVVKQCEDCGKYFMLGRTEHRVYAKRGYDDPCRCFGCGVKRNKFKYGVVDTIEIKE